MAYAVMTTWKHKNPIDWDTMVPRILSTPEGTTVQWFAIDEHNQGSFATYASKEVYEDFKAKLEEWRKVQPVEQEIEKTKDEDRNEISHRWFKNRKAAERWCVERMSGVI